MRRHWLLAIVWVVGFLVAGEAWAADDAKPAPPKIPQKAVRQNRNQQALLTAEAPAAKSVEMLVDYGDGVQVRFTALPWREKMTALDAVSAASDHPHGVKFVWRGKESTAFVTQIEDVKNQGGGKESQNWLYSVNDKEGEVGIGDCTLQPGDVILWRFGVLDNNGN